METPVLEINENLATRHAWLAIEIALAGPSIWKAAGGALAYQRQRSLTQQLEALVDLLGLAGLAVETADCADLRQELREARRAGRLAITVDNGDGPLGRLLSLRLPWGQSLFLAIEEFFTERAAPRSPNLSSPRAAESEPGCLRCLEIVAELIDGNEAALIQLVDQADDPLREDDGPDATADETVQRLRAEGVRCLQRGDYPHAVAQFTAALRLAPALSELYVHRGDAYRLMCEFERAIADYDIGLRLGASPSALLISRALALLLSRDFDRAVADCTVVLEDLPDHAVALRTRAAAYFELKLADLAQADLRVAIEQNPDDEASLFQRGVVGVMQRDLARAVADFNRVLHLNPYHVAAYLQRADAHRRLGEYALSIKDYTEVLRHHPSNVAALTGRGFAYRLNNDVDRAVADYTAALRFDPEHVQAYYSRGVLQRLAGRLDLAQDDLEAALTRQPEHWAARYHRAKIFLAHGLFETALQDLTETINLNPRLAAPFLSRAIVQDRLGRFEAGIADAAEAIALNGNLPAPYLIRGVIAGHLGDCDAAVADLTRALELDNQLAIALLERGTIHILQARHELALADSTRLVELEPSKATGYLLRSAVRRGADEMQLALTDYALALQIDAKCILVAWSQNLAEAARNQATQRLADYIDGLRLEPVSADPPLPVEFQVILRPHEASPCEILPSAPAALSSATKTKTARPGRGADKSLNRQPGGTVSQPKRTGATGQTAVETAVLPVRGGATETALAIASPDTLAPSPNGKADQVLKSAEPTGAATAGDTPATTKHDTAAIIDDFVAEPIEAGSRGVVAPAPGADANALAQSDPSPPPAKVACVLCRHVGAPAEVLAAGRVRCGGCAAVFLPTAHTAAPIRLTRLNKPRPRKTASLDEDEAPTLLARLKRPVPLLGATAALILIYLFFPHSLFGVSNRVAVYPARGKIEYLGRAIPNASILLHVVGAKENDVPQPHATVKEDGTFVIGTYGSEDGAPPGDYKVTVQWYRNHNPGKDSDVLPRNELPARYAQAEHSGITVSIRVGENDLPTIELKR